MTTSLKTENFTKKIIARSSLGNTFQYTCDNVKVIMDQDKSKNKHSYKVYLDGFFSYEQENTESREEILEFICTAINDGAIK